MSVAEILRLKRRIRSIMIASAAGLETHSFGEKRKRMKYTCDPMHTMLRLLSYRTLAFNPVAELLILLHLVQVIANGCYNQLDCRPLVAFLKNSKI